MRLAGKIEALRLLAQWQGMLVERVEQVGPQSVRVTIGVAPTAPRAIDVTPRITPRLESGEPAGAEALRPSVTRATAHVQTREGV